MPVDQIQFAIQVVGLSSAAERSTEGNQVVLL
jgi:hypothetical protein